MISPWVAGQTLPVWQETWTDDSDNPENLTGATVTLLILPPGGTAPSNEVTGTGTVVLTAPTLGQFTYAVAATDFTSTGSYSVRWRAVYSSGTLYSDSANIWVNPS
jgi:hypothetical protein